MARSTRGLAFIGPGPIKRRGSGLSSSRAERASASGLSGGNGRVMDAILCIHRDGRKYTVVHSKASNQSRRRSALRRAGIIPLFCHVERIQEQ